MQMMQQYMTMMAASGANPMMTNPMMMGNPMMTNPAMMGNPMMTNPAMMGNPMMTNPAMSAAPQPQIKVNLDPTSQAVGQIPDPNQRRP
jgi:CCR4-NOT transcriptional complex subunit CAF120